LVLEAVFFEILPESRDSSLRATTLQLSAKASPRGAAKPMLNSDMAIGGDVP
jgi:hypothetical protein